jgi:hypothetical protein
MARTSKARDPAMNSFGRSGRPQFLAYCLIEIAFEVWLGHQPLRRVVCTGLTWRHLHFAQPKNWALGVNITNFLASCGRKQVIGF